MIIHSKETKDLVIKLIDQNIHDSEIVRKVKAIQNITITKMTIGRWRKVYKNKG
jgi:hypothetical protein